MAQAGPSQSTGRDTGTNPAEGFGLFKVDLADHLNVSTIQRLSILIGLLPGEIDSIKRSKTPGLEMVNLLDERGFITPTDIRDLLKMLRKLKLAGLAARIQSSFQTKTSQAKKDQDLAEKKRDFIKYSKTAYRKYYETAKPFPSMSKCSVNSIFVEGGIYYLAQEGDSMQMPDVLEPLESYNEILSSPQTKSMRKIIEGDPGYGKSTLASQFVYDWCTENPESPLKKFEILIFIQLRQLTGVKSIYTAIKNSIVPKDEDMDESCIKKILKAYKKSVVMLFDSYDEYPDKNETKTDIFSIIGMKMFLDILVIILTRTLNLPTNLNPETKRIRLTGFGEAERRKYVRKAVADDVQLADQIEEQLQRNPFLKDLCQIPLFSTMVAHIAHERPEIEIFSTVTRFFTYVIACVHNHMKIKKDANTGVPAFETELAKLYRIAFDGLTQKNQQLSWEKTFLFSELGQEFYDNYINLGMLAQEVVFDIPQGRYKTVARIWHKILCEFYASHHLVWILSEGASSAASSINVKETLNSINPLDLQYVYRFACGLNKSAADIIIKHLQETKEGRQFAILCMLEQEEKSDQFMQSVKDLVSSEISIREYDAILLQRSTIQVLEVASAKQIPISRVYLGSCSPRFDESGLNLILQSGLSLSILSSLQKLWIWDLNRRLTNEELAAILSYSSQCTSLKELRFQYYFLPDTIPIGSIPSSLKSRNVKVWNFIDLDKYRRLNLQTDQCQMEVRLHSRNSNEPSTTKAVKDIDLDTSLSIQSLVNKDGGILEIPGTGVKLEIPFGAIEQECSIQMRIIPISFREESKSSFTSNSTVVVELLPDNLKLHQVAKLTLPHCLQLKKTGERKAMVYSSHHAKGSKPMWRPKPNVSYQLNETNCVIWIGSFSWETCEIDGKIVEFKQIQVYAARNLDPLPEIIPIHVGFYPKLPGEKPNNLQILEEIPFLFRKEGNLPLKIIFKEVQPKSWKYTGEEKVKTIPYLNVAAPVAYRHSFFFEKVGEEACFLVFEAVQEDPVKLVVNFKRPSVPSHEAIRGEAGGNPAGAQAMTKDSEQVTEATLLDLSENLSEGWRDVGRKLELEETDLWNIEADNKSNGQKEVVYKMLLLWKRKRGMAATNKKLRDALKAAKQKDLHDHFLNCGKFGTTSVWNRISVFLYRRLNLQIGQWQAGDYEGNLPGEEGFDERSYQLSLARFNSRGLTWFK